jgi:hypothetical protein
MEMAFDHVHATTPEEQLAVRELPTGTRTLHKSLRRLLEHEWEHLAELFRRPVALVVTVRNGGGRGCSR